MRKIIAMLAASVLLATGCEWFVSESGQVLIGRQEPAQWSMTGVDLSDLVVPVELLSVPDGRICASFEDFSPGQTICGGRVDNPWDWDGNPFSWQCYQPVLAWWLDGQPDPVVVEPLEVVVNASAGDFVRVTYQPEGLGTVDPVPSCASEPDFVPLRDTAGNARTTFPPIFGGCVGPLIDGEFEGFKAFLGPLEPGLHTISLGCDYSNGVAFPGGSQLLVVEVFDATSSGTVP